MELDGFPDGIGRITFSSNGEALLVADCGRRWGVREIGPLEETNGAAVRVLAVAGPPVPEGEDEDDGSFFEWPRGICHDHDAGFFLADSGESMHVALHLALPDARLVGRIQPETSYPMALALSPDRQTIAMLDFKSGPEPQHAIILANATNKVGKEDKDLPIHGRTLGRGCLKSPNDVTFSPDGVHLLVADRGVIWVFDVASGSLVKEIEIGGDAQGLAVDSQGRLFVASDTCVQLFAPLPICAPLDKRVCGLDLSRGGRSSLAVRLDGLVAVATGGWFDDQADQQVKPKLHAFRVS